MKLWIFLLVFLSCIFLENTYILLPLTFDLLLLYYITTRNPVVFSIAFVAGIVTDMLSVKTVGISSLFFLLVLLIVILYERKFEIQTYPFVFFASLFGGSVYLYFLTYGSVFLPALVNSIIVVMLFRLTKKISNRSI